MPNPFEEDGISDEDIQREMDESEEVFQGRIELAEKAAVYWRRISPVGDPVEDPHPGRYVESIKVTVEGRKVEVGSDDPIANLIEYGSIHNPEYAPRAQVQAKFRYTDQ